MDSPMTIITNKRKYQMTYAWYMNGYMIVRSFTHVLGSSFYLFILQFNYMN